MEKIVTTKDVRIETNFPEQWPARVDIFLTTGEHFERYVRHPKGDPENPLNWEELSAKFQSLAARVLPASRCEQISSGVRDLRQVTVLPDLWKLTSATGPAFTDRS
jgi:2-methylcitrate dehydratase PrpD